MSAGGHVLRNRIGPRVGTDLDNLIIPGDYAIDTPINGPGSNTLIVSVRVYDPVGVDRLVFQSAVSLTGDNEFHRFYNGTIWSAWVETDTSGGSGFTNLAMSRDSDSVTIESDTGDDAEIPPADTNNAGVMTADMFDKLAGIEAGAEVNIGTDLAIGTHDDVSLEIESSTGNDIVLPAATLVAGTNKAGLFTSAEKTKLAGIATGATVYTDEMAQDAVGGILDNGTVGDIVFTYNDGGPSISAVIENAAVTYAKFQDVTALSVVGRSANTDGVSAAITAASDDLVLRRSGTSIGFGTIVAGGIASNAVTTAKILDANVTYAKIQNAVTGMSVVGRAANSAGVNADIDATVDHTVLRRSGTSVGFGAIDLSQNNAITGQLRGSSFPALTGAVVSAGATLATTATIDLVIPMGGTALATGIIAGVDVHCDFAFTIVQWTLLGNASGSLVIDIWKDTYANFPPTVADTITASAKPTISTATKGQSSTLTGWTTSVAVGDILRFNVDSVTTIVAATLILKVTKTS